MGTELHEDQQYHGEFRYVNMGPEKVRAMLESETCQSEIEALELAKRFWAIKSPRMGEGGEPYRGEEPAKLPVQTMAELAAAVKPVEHVFVIGKLTANP